MCELSCALLFFLLNGHQGMPYVNLATLLIIVHIFVSRLDTVFVI
jgi:hypothetical protein